MFEFLFKRQGDKTGNGRGAQATVPAKSAPAQAAPAGQGGTSNKKAGAGDTAPASAPARNAALREQQAAQLKTLDGDEARAVDFILACEFSELRLSAAELVHSRAGLERVHAAIRNTDRRVAKLMQSRLDALRHHEAELARGQATLAQARALLADDHLTPEPGRRSRPQVGDHRRARTGGRIRTIARPAGRPPGSASAAAARHDRPPGRSCAASRRPA